MKRNFKADVERVKGKDFFFCIPISEFESIQELTVFVDEMSKNGISALIKAEHSNFFNGVSLDLYDKEYIDPKILKEVALRKRG